MTLYKEYRKWRTHNLLPQDGIILGCDEAQEWLLPWWWNNYTSHNAYPVSFVDFGLSPEKKAWCRERGDLIRLPVANIFVKEREEIDPSTVNTWEHRYGEQFWNARHAWFKKPLACLQSPYKRTIWIDVDCEIIKPLKELFAYCEHPSGLALAKDRSAESPSHTIYNSGVIVFQRDVPPLEKWADQAFEQTNIHRGDQDLLSEILAQHSIAELPAIYNWHVGYGLDPNVAIYHWLGKWGKAALQAKISKY